MISFSNNVTISSIEFKGNLAISTFGGGILIDLSNNILLRKI